MSILGKWFGRRGKDGDGPLSLEDFARDYAAALHRARPDADIETSAADARVKWTLPDGASATQFVGNYHARYLQAPQDKDALFAQMIGDAQAVMQRMQTGAADDGVIVAVLKTDAWQGVVHQQMDAMGVAQESRPYIRPLGGGLVVGYALDTPDSMNWLSCADIDTKGLGDADALHAHALENLAARIPDMTIAGGGGRFAARLDRNYDASMALLFDRWGSGLEVRGFPVLCMPARDEMLVCGSDDIDSLLALVEMAETIVAQSAYALTDRMFTFRDGRLVPLRVLRRGDDVVVLVDADG